MTTMQQNEAGTRTANASEWRQVVIEVENLRQEYARRVSADESGHDERAINQLWLRLWRAERRRDELLKRAD
jgi:hypothetical protein